MRKRSGVAEDNPYEDTTTTTTTTTSNESSSNNNMMESSHNNTNRMQPMSISMGKDYDSTLQQRRESSHRKVIILAVLTVLSVVLSWMIVGSKKATAAHQTTSHCRSYNAAYFKRLSKQVEETEDESHLCITAIVTNHDLCRCKNPFVPRPQQQQQQQQQQNSSTTNNNNDMLSLEQWTHISRMNAALMAANYSDKQPDVVVYGDSITERVLGRFFGRYGPKMQAYTRVMEQIMTKAGGGKLDALPMGISSDQIPHLLYRMKNGELPEFLHPQVWWILMGSNDLAVGCSGDVVVAGVIRLVQEIKDHLKHHHAKRGEAGKHAPIVMNSILPRAPARLDTNENPYWRVTQDVNLRLSCYADITSDVSFANTTKLFIRQEHKATEGRDGIYIHPDMYERDKLHPSVEGSRRWETFVVDEALSLVAGEAH